MMFYLEGSSRRRSTLLLTGGFNFCSLPGFSYWMGPLTIRSATCFTYPIDSDISLIQKHYHSISRIMVDQSVQTSHGLVNLTHKISHHSKLRVALNKEQQQQHGKSRDITHKCEILEVLLASDKDITITTCRQQCAQGLIWDNIRRKVSATKFEKETIKLSLFVKKNVILNQRKSKNL